MNLYKKDSKGKIRVLNIYTDGAKLIQESGLYGGKLVVNSTICKPKNVGRSNETTAEEQAVLEKDAKIKDKLTKGYFTNIEDAKQVEVILPMLAKDYKKESHKIDWEKHDVFAQPKLDGMRCLAHIVNGKLFKLESRDGKIITDTTDALDHIVNALKSPRIGGNIILDGELYAHGYSFQENMQMIKSKKENSEEIKFHVYDTVRTNMRFSGRYIITRDCVKLINNDNILLVPTVKLKVESNLKKAHTVFIKNGYEGTIVRLNNEFYKPNVRSSQLLKYKDFKDIACKIIDIGPAKRRPTWGRPVVEWNGVQFACGTKMSHKEREELLKNKSNYIGKTAEIRYFEESDTGVPRFPVMVGIRLDK